MPWTNPITFEDGDPLTAAQLNTFLRANLLETGPGRAAANGRLLTTLNVNQIGERQWARDYNHQDISLDRRFPVSEDAEGSTYGPEVTVEHGGRMLILFDASIRTIEGTGNAIYAPMIDGRSPDSSHYALRSGREGVHRSMGCILWTESPPGVSTVTMAYGTYSSSTTCLYSHRRLTVIPM